MTLLTNLANYKQSDSPASRFRARRFALFSSLAARLSRPLRILDVGGTEAFWKTMGFADEPDVCITTVNIEVEPGAGQGHIEALQGDACDLHCFADQSFDIVFSNSVIEHVGGVENQRRCAREIQRVGKAFFVQTPNKNFPIEPHFMFPFFQFLSVPARVYLLTHFHLGYCGKISDPAQAQLAAQEIELLNRQSFCALFPGAQIWDERVFGLVKSFVAYGGFPNAPSHIPPSST